MSVPSSTFRAANNVGAVALVIVRQGSGAALLHRQARLSPVERLNLAFLVDRQDDGVRWGIDIEADNVPELLRKFRIFRQFEGANAVRSKLVGLQNALNRTQTDTCRRGQHPASPVGGFAWWRRQRQINDLLHRAGRERRLAGLACLVAHPPRPLP
jgi:hypothetical protein